LAIQEASGARASLVDASTPLVQEQAIEQVWDLKQLGLVEARERHPARLDGQRADLLGFVYRPDTETAEDQFSVGRFLVRCCTADAVAISIPVRSPGTASPDQDTWVRVQGTIRVADGAEPFVVADSVQVVPAPSRPYLQLP
jgi:uncharacterized repeat protein (TIGR03943 family)